LGLARRLKTELRLPAISYDGSNWSNGRVFSLGKTSTSHEGSKAWMMPPSRSALFSFSARKTTPLRPEPPHCVSKWRAIMPNGAVEEIAVRGEGFSRFFARLTPRDLLERPTLFSSLIRNQLRLMASWFRSSPPRCWELCLAPRAYANFVAGARFRSNCPVGRCFGHLAPLPISSCQAVSQANLAMARWGPHAGYAHSRLSRRTGTVSCHRHGKADRFRVHQFPKDGYAGREFRACHRR
jgi:hypothetical protein